MGQFLFVTELDDLEKIYKKIYFHKVILKSFYRTNCQKVIEMEIISGQKSKFENFKHFFVVFIEFQLYFIRKIGLSNLQLNTRQLITTDISIDLTLETCDFIFILNQQNLHIHIELHWVQWDIWHVHWHRSAFRVRAKVTFVGGVSLKSEEDLMGTEKKV